MNASGKEVKHLPSPEKGAESHRESGEVVSETWKENSCDDILGYAESQNKLNGESDLTDDQQKSEKCHQINNEKEGYERFCSTNRDCNPSSEYSHTASQNTQEKEMAKEYQSSILMDTQRHVKTILEEIDAEPQGERNELLSNSAVECEKQGQDKCLSVARSPSENVNVKEKENNSLVEISTSSSAPGQNGCSKTTADINGLEKCHQNAGSCAEKLEGVKVDHKSTASLSLKEDPFSLSADEDFSPKLYRPLQRKISMCPDKSKLNLKRSASPLNGDGAGFDFEQLPCIPDRLEDSEPTDCVPERKKLKHSRQVVYIHNKEMVEKTNRLWRIEGRGECELPVKVSGSNGMQNAPEQNLYHSEANLVHSLINVYGILRYIDTLEPRYATDSEILGFHCQDYVKFLKSVSDDDEYNSDSVIGEAEDYGLSYDCPLQKDCFQIASLISGGTIMAAESLCEDKANIAVNWCGGWHHAKRDSASGFCYLNDIVLGILKLRERFDKVLYIDIDLHHGDGVEEAFYMTPKVMTVSFHKHAAGFFPGSGNVEDIGTGRGKYYAVNVPLMDGIKDNEFCFIFSSIMKSVKEKFKPEAVVMQCGADTLAEDPMLSFNLTHLAIAKCVCFVLAWNLPTLLLGGGGYHFANTAKCWTYITALAAGKKLPVDIPEHENLLEYGPSYELTTLQGYRKNCNSKEYLRQLLVQVHSKLTQFLLMAVPKSSPRC